MYATIKIFYKKSETECLFLYSTNCKKTIAECKMDIEFRLSNYKKDRVVVLDKDGSGITYRILRMTKL